MNLVGCGRTAIVLASVGIAFTPKASDEFSRVAVLLSAGLNFICRLLVEPILGRNVGENRLTEHKSSGPNIALTTHSHVIGNLKKHALQLSHHFELSAHQQVSHIRERMRTPQNQKCIFQVLGN